MYDPFIKHLTEKAPETIEGFKLINTSQNPDVCGMKDNPGVSCYKSTVKIDKVHPTRYEDIELIFEFKTRAKEADPFEDTPDDKAAAKPFPSEAPAEARTHCRGQITSYTRVWCGRQHRNHCFIVWIADPHSQIIRIELLTFLWSFCHSPNSLRGLHQIVTKASPEENQLAHDKLSKWNTTSTYDVFKIQVPNLAAGSGQMCEFLVWCTLAEPRSVTGRATRGYAAASVNDGSTIPRYRGLRSTG